MVMDGSSLFLFRDVFCFDDARFDDDGVPSSWLLGTYLSDEAGGNGERPIGDRHRKRRQTARRRTEHDFRDLAGIIFGIVSHALENFLVANVLLHPGGDRTPGMNANRRIGDNAVGRMRLGVIVKFLRVEPDEQDLVQSRAAAHHRRLRIFWPRPQRRTTGLEIVGLDRLALIISLGDNKQVSLLRSQVGAGLIVPGDGSLGRGEAGSACESRQ